jgi:hypothetical protein
MATFSELRFRAFLVEFPNRFRHGGRSQCPLRDDVIDDVIGRMWTEVRAPEAKPVRSSGAVHDGPTEFLFGDDLRGVGGNLRLEFGGAEGGVRGAGGV